MNWQKLTLSDDYLVWMRRIRATPDDDLPRLIFADWLEEQGDTIYCHFIRQQCEPVEPEKVYYDESGEVYYRRDPNRKPTRKEIQEGFVRREVIEQVMPMLAGSYKLSRGFISEVSITPTEYLGMFAGWYLWERLRCTQPEFTVVIEPHSDFEHYSAGTYPPNSRYHKALDGYCIQHQHESGNVSPLVKWCSG